MKVLRQLISLGFFAIYGALSAQDTLSINPQALDSLQRDTFILDNPVLQGNSPAFGIWVYNKGDSIYADSISFDYAINPHNGFLSFYNTSTFNGAGFSFPTQRIVILPHDSALLFTLQAVFNDPVFEIGSSTVVIWPHPYKPNTTVLDSAYAQVTVTTASGIAGSLKEDLKVYSAQQVLYVQSASKNLVKDIRIFDVAGKLLPIPATATSNTIPLEKYACGVYFVEVLMQNNERQVYKIFNLPGR